MSESRNKGGRPPKYKTKEEIEEKINAYFKSCDGRPLLNDEGAPICDKYGYPIIIDQHPPTVTGLALALGFECRLSLINYQGKKEFHEVITRAKSRIEAYTEERLFDKDGANGAKFSLQNNFKGWTPDKDAEESPRREVIIVELTRKKSDDADV